MRSKGQSSILPSAVPCALRGICHHRSSPSAPATPRSRGEACRVARSEVQALQALRSPRLSKCRSTSSSCPQSTRRSPSGVTSLAASWQLPGSSSEHRCRSTRRFCWVRRVTTLKPRALGKHFSTAQAFGACYLHGINETEHFSGAAICTTYGVETLLPPGDAPRGRALCFAWGREPGPQEPTSPRSPSPPASSNHGPGGWPGACKPQAIPSALLLFFLLLFFSLGFCSVSREQFTGTPEALIPRGSQLCQLAQMNPPQIRTCARPRHSPKSQALLGPG